MHYSKEGPRRNGVLHQSLSYFMGALIVAFSVVVQSPRAQLYGNGSDGALTVSGTMNLAKNMNFSNLTILAGATLETRGYEVRVSGVLLNGGTITDSYSGGKGGNGGTAGAGGSAGSGNAGINGGAGIGGTIGAGLGGNGGGGGAGGGGAHDAGNSKTAYGGNGGYGGQGGTGGGKIRIYAHELNNIGVIHANGFPGNNGGPGAQGGYVSYTELLIFNRDLAGGGGGGGGGGNGGSGGTVTIVYAVLTNLGTVTVYGGAGGLGGPYGSGRNTLYASSGSAYEYSGGVGALYDANGGSGGYGEKDDVASGYGGSGENGYWGSAGTKTLTQSVVCYVDVDGDGFGSAADPGQDVDGSCGAGYSLNHLDCNDSQAGIHPGATEIPNDGIDQDCDGYDNVRCYIDADGDGYGSSSDPGQIVVASCGPGYALTNSDCDDSRIGVHPGATEIVGDGIDQNCDGVDNITCYADPDSDGRGILNSRQVFAGTCGLGYVHDSSDNCPLTPNPDQSDADRDGIGDLCDPCALDSLNDADHDGFCANVDNCSGVANPGQEDRNHDGRGDACCCISLTGNIDGDPADAVDIADLSALIDFLYISFTSPGCMLEANTDGQPGVDIADLSALIDYLYISFAPTAACQ